MRVLALAEARHPIVHHLQARFPTLQAVYAFGSRVRAQAGTDSDLDLAILLPTRGDPCQLWDEAQDIAELMGCPVDLVDLRGASTVLQYQVITTGERWWHRDSQTGLFECAVLSDKTELDSARAGLLADIRERGHIHGG